jgi:hypothetical protein
MGSRHKAQVAITNDSGVNKPSCTDIRLHSKDTQTLVTNVRSLIKIWTLKASYFISGLRLNYILASAGIRAG